MNKIKCFFGLHKTKTIGYGGFFSFKISQCEHCEGGFQETDYGPILKWITRVKMKPEAFKKYLDSRKYGNKEK